jgi:hypothetical protein
MLGAEMDIIFHFAISSLCALHLFRAQFLCIAVGFAYSPLVFLYIRVAFARARLRFLLPHTTLLGCRDALLDFVTRFLNVSVKLLRCQPVFAPAHARLLTYGTELVLSGVRFALACATLALANVRIRGVLRNARLLTPWRERWSYVRTPRHLGIASRKQINALHTLLSASYA